MFYIRGGMSVQVSYMRNGAKPTARLNPNILCTVGNVFSSALLKQVSS